MTLKWNPASLIVATAVLGFIVSTPWADATVNRPNIVFILADDMGYGDCSANNPDSQIPTPNLDQLAKEGLRFTDAHSAATVCTPSRYGLLTGINPAREGIINPLLKFGEPLIKEATPTIGGLLQEHGYTTKMVGKWHLGWHMDMSSGAAEFDFSKPLTGGPVDRGFDYYYGINKSPSAPPYFFIRNRGAVAKPTGHIERPSNVKDRRLSWQPGACAPGYVHTEVVANTLKETVTLINDHADSNTDKPMFIYFALTAPHTPLVPSEKFAGKSKVGAYGDFIMEIDDLVGKVNGALKEKGMEKNTILIFSSDNGALFIKGDRKKHGHSVNGLLRGGKANPYEGGHRVPFLVKWPGVVPASTVTDATINFTDMFATLLDILEVKDREKYLLSAVDSYSFLSVLKDPGAKFVRPTMFNNSGTCRIGEWKIVAGRKVLQGSALDKGKVELYNLDKDLGETTDLSRKNPERLEQLVKTYDDFRSNWAIRPEAIKLQESKKKPGKKTPPRKNNAAQTRRASKDSHPSLSIAELHREMEKVYTEEQKKTRDAAKKKAVIP